MEIVSIAVRMGTLATLPQDPVIPSPHPVWEHFQPPSLQRPFNSTTAIWMIHPPATELLIPAASWTTGHMVVARTPRHVSERKVEDF